MRIPSRTRLCLLIFLFCLLVNTLLLLLAPSYRGVPTTDGDEPHYLLITQSLLEDHDLAVENDYLEGRYKVYYQQEIDTPHTTDGRGGRSVSTHPPFISLVILPGFWLFGYRGAAFTMIIFTSAAAALTFLVIDRFADRTIAAAACLFLFLSYPLLFYARLIYPETAALFLVALGVWSTWRLKESQRPLFAVLGGVAAGLILLFHPKFVALTAALFFLSVLVARRDKRLLTWWLAPAALLFGTLLLLTGITYGPNLLRGLTASGGGRLVGGYLGENSFWGIVGMFLDRAWGLFIFAPLYLLFPHGMSLQNNRMEWTRWWLFFPVCISAHVLLLGVFQSWNGGAAPVQRYLVPVASLFVICIAVFVERCRSALARATASLFALLQIITTVWAFRFMAGTYGMAGIPEMNDNSFIPFFLGPENPIKKLLFFIFPLYHPVDAWSVALTFLWLGLFAVTIYLSRRYYMRHGGAKLSPVLDIRPFESADGGSPAGGGKGEE